MTCKHLQMIALCTEHHLRLLPSEVIRIVCPTCGEEEECPSVLYDEYASRHPEPEGEAPKEE